MELFIALALFIALVVCWLTMPSFNTAEPVKHEAEVVVLSTSQQNA